MWVFGYGSLVWNPGFEYSDSKLGYIEGYTRKFWQGNDYHRGTAEKPGRVATLEEDKRGSTWGRAFLLKDGSASESLNYLENRESKCGDYCTVTCMFKARNGESLPVYVYIATPSNRQYLGPAPLDQLANQIVDSRGACGHNVEYLFRLSQFMQYFVPDVLDDHLFSLERLVRNKLKNRGILIESLMGEIPEIFLKQSLVDEQNNRQEEQAPTEGEYTSMITTRKLRCLNI